MQPGQDQPEQYPQQPYQQPYGQPYQQQQPYGHPYQQPQYGNVPPQPVPRKVVEKQRGLSAGSHTFHLLATIFTCGVWGLFVWLPWWLFRVIVRRKKVTRYHYE
ncbi:hypothetical protein [Planotetraspora mira]|uniref:Uncharacterized protein n=1 Tax=Planotetraspora mira TaxID=58121 RepID=A0A8J3TSX0_9ACTN|nr:hypothetical protein [Planotetraspora mira]GII32573.1 hypothetical protein Pmi06nite_60150 [Planotetraspora mira]